MPTKSNPGEPQPGENTASHLMSHIPREVFDKKGRIVPQKVGAFLNASPAEIARLARVTPASIKRHPFGKKTQERLRLIVYIMGVLVHMLEDKNEAIIWLKAPHPDIGGRTPLQVIEEGHPETVLDLLEASYWGDIG